VLEPPSEHRPHFADVLQLQVRLRACCEQVLGTRGCAALPISRERGGLVHRRCVGQGWHFRHFSLRLTAYLMGLAGRIYPARHGTRRMAAGSREWQQGADVRVGMSGPPTGGDQIDSRSAFAAACRRSLTSANSRAARSIRSCWTSVRSCCELERVCWASARWLSAVRWRFISFTVRVSSASWPATLAMSSSAVMAWPDSTPQLFYHYPFEAKEPERRPALYFDLDLTAWRCASTVRELESARRLGSLGGSSRSRSSPPRVASDRCDRNS
jgi:hypothetical protein